MSGWHRTSRQSRGYGAEYMRNRERAIERDKGLCQPCLREGRTIGFDEVDHIKPKAKGIDNSLANLQCICRRCHQAKTAEENGRTLKPKVRIGISGWPVED